MLPRFLTGVNLYTIRFGVDMIRELIRKVGIAWSSFLYEFI